MTIVAIVQARMGSSRLPGKVMTSILGRPMIEILLERVSKAKRLDRVIVATSINAENQPLVDHLSQRGYDYFQGSEDDVLARYVSAAKQAGADIVVRITGDCPLIDAEIIDECVDRFLAADVDYLSNTINPSFPDGLDVEVMSFAALARAMEESATPFDHEHVTPYLRTSGNFRIGTFQNDEDHSEKRWTVDDANDLTVVSGIFDHFAPDIHFTWKAVLALYAREPALFDANAHSKRNSTIEDGSGQRLWRRAKKIIPGGNMLLSKRPEMFLPDQWPAYFSKAKGCHVWDLDGREYVDMSIMGIGTNTLGYGHPEVDEAVRQTIGAGNMSTLNCPEEVYLAEKLCELHPWADMVRFARSGGEANAIAIRIARAASGRDKVAVCGYHGWHDWYLSANLGADAALDGHLLPGLEPKGVPRALQGSVLTFNYNDIDQLRTLVEEHDIGVIKMEVSRNAGPEPGFLEQVRQISYDKDIILIFDECTSGFRETYGGLHKKFGVEPDMAMFGKALGNGYAVTATIGRREIMEAAQSTFISSTFWTERIGSSAALATLAVMEREKSWETITATGIDIKERWRNLAERHGLSIIQWGLPALAGFSFIGPNALAYKTIITQEMLTKGYLASNSIYVCTAHTPAVVDAYFEAIDPIFALIRECEDGRNIDDILKGPVCHAGFNRLN
jgi:glutamate-1-semialdehyde 2,1-aminomutase